MTGSASGNAVSLFNNLLVFVKSLTQALQETQVDQEVDQRVVIGDGWAVAQMRTFDAEGHRLRVDALDGGALSIDGLVFLAVTVEGVAQASADTGGHHRGAAAASGIDVVDRTGDAAGSPAR